ncbi:hypothetical protein EZV73_11735 [Acidaminobacter sp. JC074]|uniref:hypothetical protein n=1 Tax=Acidaminobacter sp. JC074 TaxID=2530199 RepID=UPI001F1010B4|nr:hypothetical protein [Acidaminobacter sp. JC074]MCH4888250.1 hypothetical protein [Acidaminobacter sp. JC074]
MKKIDVLNNLVDHIELDRIRKLPVTEKFKLYEYVKLIYTEAEYACKEGIKQLEKSPNYTINKTYNLFAMLIVNLGDYDLVKEIIVNYGKNFETSDIYYAQITITGMGLLMIEKNFDPDAIYHFLMNLLGTDFLIENLHTTANADDLETEGFKLDSTIKYKPFEGDIRKLKYDLLALLKIRHDKGMDYVTDIINKKYGNAELAFFFNMLDSKSEEVLEYLNQEFMEKENRRTRLIAAGAYALLKERSILSAHYLFNSIIGKYSRFDKRKEEIDNEIDTRLKEIDK